MTKKAKKWKTADIQNQPNHNTKKPHSTPHQTTRYKKHANHSWCGKGKRNGERMSEKWKRRMEWENKRKVEQTFPLPHQTHIIPLSNTAPKADILSGKNPIFAPWEQR